MEDRRRFLPPLRLALCTAAILGYAAPSEASPSPISRKVSLSTPASARAENKVSSAPLLTLGPDSARVSPKVESKHRAAERESFARIYRSESGGKWRRTLVNEVRVLPVLEESATAALRSYPLTDKKGNTVSDFWYEHADGSHSKFIVSDSARVIGLLSVSDTAGFNIQLDVNGDRTVDVGVRLSLDAEETIYLHGEAGRDFVRQTLEGFNPICELKGERHTDSLATFDACPVYDSDAPQVGGSGFDSSSGASAINPFGGWNSPIDDMCTDLQASRKIYGQSTAGFLSDLYDATKNFIHNGFDGEEDGNGAKFGRTMLSVPLLMVTLIPAYGLDFLITEPADAYQEGRPANPLVNPIATAAGALGAAVGNGQDGAEAADQDNDADGGENQDDAGDEANASEAQPEQAPEEGESEPEANGGENATQPIEEGGGLADYCRARASSREFWFRQTGEKAVETDCVDAVINPAPINAHAPGSQTTTISCMDRRNEAPDMQDPTLPREDVCRNRAASSSSACPGDLVGSNAKVSHGFGETLNIKLGDIACPPSVCSGAPIR